MTAKKNLLRDGFLYPVAFVRDQNGKVMARLVELSKVPSEKRAYLNRLGSWLRTQGVVVTEAVLLSEGWFVEATRVPAALSIPPSQHPARQEAITIVGRNAEGNQVSSVVQVFGRDKDNQVVWGKVALAIYNQVIRKDERVESLLDYLFIEAKGGDQYGTGQTLQSEKRFQA